ncbi:MAG: hypothetical protein ACYTHM_04065 [Planctomycetota bacterium]
MMSKILSVILLTALSGCVSQGKRTEKLPVVALVYADSVKEECLNTDYGTIIDWRGDREPSFYLFDRNRASRVKYSSWDEFLLGIQALPNGIQIDRVNRCQVPFDYALPEEKKQAFMAVLEQKGISLVDDSDLARHLNLCTCETKEVKILFDSAR